MSDHEDILNLLRAQIDQTVAGMGELARAVAAYHRELCAEGLTEEQALVLTVAWQTQILTQPPEGG